MRNVQPFSSQGEFMMVELHEKRGTEYEVTVCKNPDDKGKTALLEFYNGDTIVTDWNNIKWIRSKVERE